MVSAGCDEHRSAWNANGKTMFDLLPNAFKCREACRILFLERRLRPRFQISMAAISAVWQGDEVNSLLAKSIGAPYAGNV